MSMSVVNGAKIGDLLVSIYDYVKAGDCLPMHNHDEATSHIIIVVRGRVMVRIMTDKDVVENSIHECGVVLDTHAGFPHEIIGLEDNTRTVHVVKKLMPTEVKTNGTD